MAGNLVKTIPIAEGQTVCFFDGSPCPNVVSVKLPVREHGEVSVHPMGAVSPQKYPDGTETYEDMDVEFAQSANLSNDPLYLYWTSVVNPKTGVGLPAEQVEKVFQVVDLDNAGKQKWVHVLTIWPKKRDPGKREGGGKDPKKFVLTFAINSYDEHA
jgi:hypothetical protein